VAYGSDGEDVELEQLEQHAQAQPSLQVADDEPRPRGRDERPRDHHLGHAHQIEPDQGPPQQQGELDVDVHTNSSSGTARAVGTSCAVISMPHAASCRSLAASASVRYTYRSFSERPARWCTPPMFTRRMMPFSSPATAAMVSMSPARRMPGRGSAFQSA